jgi:hypothetical protein
MRFGKYVLERMIRTVDDCYFWFEFVFEYLATFLPIVLVAGKVFETIENSLINERRMLWV